MVEADIRPLGFRGASALVVVAFVAACTSGGPSFLSRTEGLHTNSPMGIDPNEQGVDGLIVGHRLMEAGEYELALRSYMRAAAVHGLNADVLSAMGSANLHLGRLNQAEDLLRKASDEDPNFVPALNNLGVVLMERNKFGEARLYFQRAFAADSGQTDAIRENLKLAIAKSEAPVYAEPEETPRFTLVRRGNSTYELLSTL